MCENCKTKSKSELNTANFKKTIVNYQLLDYLQKNIIPKLPHKHDFRTLSKCNKTIVPIHTEFGQSVEVQVMKSKEGNNAKFWGLGHCGNTFYCPVCESVRMGLHSVKIAAAIDAMEQKHNQVAFMMTLTIIHHKKMKCADLLTIMRDAWRRFKGDIGNSRSKSHSHTMLKFCSEFNCDKNVRVLEITYSTKKGWNPHFHCLFWVDKKRLQEVAKWEETLRNTWQKVLANAYAAYFSNLHTEHDKKTSKEYWIKAFKRFHNYANIRVLQNRADKKSADARGLWISKKNGKITSAVSSDYICGWGANNELTQSTRKIGRNKNSRTMYQLLEDSAKGDETATEKYIEFMQAVRYTKARARVRYSNALCKVIKEWMSTHEYKLQALKKTKADQSKWFSLLSIPKKSWNEIIDLEIDKKLHLRADILFLAANYNAEKAFQLIYDFLRFFDIEIISNSPTFWKIYAEELFNKNFEEYQKYKDEIEAEKYFEECLKKEKEIYGTVA